MNTYNLILDLALKQKGVFSFLIDPEKATQDSLKDIIPKAEQCGVDIFFIGGSTIAKLKFDSTIELLRSLTKKPVIIFPGSPEQISKNADAILFLSLISGRNPKHLIESQVSAAPYLKKINIEVIPTAYILIDGGIETTVQRISETTPLDHKNIDLIVAHALAAEYLGFKFVYLETGSGAKYSVPNEVIRAVANEVSIPIIVGGGIKSAEVAKEKIQAGAKIIVAGNIFENNFDLNFIKNFADAIHS